LCAVVAILMLGVNRMFDFHKIRRTSVNSQQSTSTRRSQVPSTIDHLQQTIGNRALGRVMQSHESVERTGSTTAMDLPVGGITVQRMIEKTNGQQVPIDWDHIAEDELQIVLNHVHDGNYELEAGDQERLRGVISRHAQVNSETQTNREEEEKEASSEDEEHLVDDEYMDFIHHTIDENEETEQEDPNYDFEKEFSPEQQEIYDKFHPMYEARMEEKGKRFPGKSAQGNMLEHNFSAFSSNMGFKEIDGNAAAKNIPGIDHFVDMPSYLFVQDKLHLSAHTAKPETYRKHYKNRPKMAKNFLKSMASDGKRGESLRTTMKSIVDNPDWTHKESAASIHGGVEKHRKEYKEAVDDDEAQTLPSIEDNKELVDQITSNIAFSIPSDMWEKLKADETISKEEMSAYLRLDLSTSDFKKILDRMQDVVAPWNEVGANSDDEAYVGSDDEEEEKEARGQEEEEGSSDEEEELGERPIGRGRKRPQRLTRLTNNKTKHRKYDSEDSSE
jgi:hypothetical protein